MITQIGDDFLHQQVLKRVPEVLTAGLHLASLEQVIGQCHIKIVKARCLTDSPLHGSTEGRHNVADKRLFQDVKVFLDGLGIDTAILRHISVIDHFAIGECCHLHKPRERRQSSH